MAQGIHGALGGRVELLVEAVGAGLQAAQGLVQRLLKGAADGHGLAHRFHLGGEHRVRFREFFEGEARYLGHHIIDAGFEGGGRGAAGDVVLQFVQGIPHRQLGGHLGNGKARGLGGQGRGAGHAGIHLDDHHAPVARIDSELYVGTPGIHADLAQHRDGGVAHDLIFLVGQGLGRRHGNGIAGMHPHGIEVLDGTDDDAIIPAVAHHLHLEFFPAQHRFFDE